MQGELMFETKDEARGKVCRLDEAALKKLETMLLKGALFYNFQTDNWTRERIKKLINDHFSISYSAAHISKIMRKLGFSLQKPMHKSYQKPEQDVKEWKENILPSLKKS
jgi:transposase